MKEKIYFIIFRDKIVVIRRGYWCTIEHNERAAIVATFKSLGYIVHKIIESKRNVNLNIVDVYLKESIKDERKRIKESDTQGELHDSRVS